MTTSKLPEQRDLMLATDVALTLSRFRPCGACGRHATNQHPATTSSAPCHCASQAAVSILARWALAQLRLANAFAVMAEGADSETQEASYQGLSAGHWWRANKLLYAAREA